MSVPEDEVEAGWVRQIAAGDRVAFERLYRRYDRRLYGYIARIAGIDRADDVLADVMVDIWCGSPRFGNKSRVSTWLIGIARHKALDAVRRGQRRQSVPIDVLRIVPDAEPGPDVHVLRSEERQRLEAALAQLPADQRETVELTFLFGLSQKEIAEISKCPVGTVKTRMFHARKALRSALGGREMDGAAS